MKPHHPEYVEEEDPDRACVVMGFQCKGCGSEVSGSFSHKYIAKHGDLEGNRARHSFKERLMRNFRDSHPADCEEALNLNICKQVHDS